MADSRVIQYVVLGAFAIYLVIYFRFDDWFKDAPTTGISLDDISQQRANHYFQTTKTANGQSVIILQTNEQDSSGSNTNDNNNNNRKNPPESAEKVNPDEEETRFQQILRAISEKFSSISSESDSSASPTSSHSCSSDSENREDEYFLSHGISMDKSVLTKIKQAIVEEDEQRADKIIHDIIQKINIGRKKLAKLSSTNENHQQQHTKNEKEKENEKEKAATPQETHSSNGKPQPSKKNECDLKWPEFKNEKHEYERVDGYQISHSFSFSGPGCIALSDQCSAETVESAEHLCDTFPNCMGFTCNKERHDCQLRFAPLKHVDTPSFISYYKPGTRQLADQREKCEQSSFVMQKGSLAAPDFQWSGVCGVDHKCVISYGLYGGDPKYTEGAIRNVELQPKIFPGWVVRIYHDQTVPQSILDELKEKGAELIEIVGIGGGIAGMFWRFLVADDETVDRYIIRDTDSRLNEREKAAVDEWIASGYSIHSIRDHPNHRRGLNGGMWGGVRGAVKNMRDMISVANRGGYGADLDFLNNKIWPAVEVDQISHDSYSCQYYKNSHPFPTERKNYEHVGQVFEHNLPRMSDINCCMINNPTPVSCRKKKEWIYG